MGSARLSQRLRRRMLVAGLTVWGMTLLLGCAAVVQDVLPRGPVLAWLLLTAVAAGAIWRFAADRVAQWALALAVLNCATFVPEWGLRVAGFRYESGIEFGFPRPEHFHRFVRDEVLLWTLDPEADGVNSKGLPGGEFDLQKQAGSVRLLYLGDSCTYEKAHLVAYPSLVQERRARRAQPGEREEFVSLAVPGYSSHQGRILAERYGALLDPDVAVVFYGWNDHWLAYGAIDSEKEVRPSTRARLANWAHVQLRVVQFASFVASRAGSAWDASGFSESAAATERVRVPIDQFEQNLRAIAGVFQASETPVVFITAPSAHGQFGVPSYLIERGFAADEAAAVALHARYSDIVRAVAESEGVWLLDLERDFAGLPPEAVRALFRADGIHFSVRGAAVVAGRIDELVQERFGR